MIQGLYFLNIFLITVNVIKRKSDSPVSIKKCFEMYGRYSKDHINARRVILIFEAC